MRLASSAELIVPTPLDSGCVQERSAYGPGVLSTETRTHQINGLI